jgi:hypothetical protein
MAHEQDSNESNEEKQKELVELLKAIPADGKKLEAMGRQAIEAGRLSQDVAPGMAEMYAGISAKSMPRSHWEGRLRTGRPGARTYRRCLISCRPLPE